MNKFAQKESVQVFLNELVDYAGLFPPASLNLDDAINNYAAYKNGNNDWMLGPFIIPTAQLTKLNSYVQMFSREIPLTISAIGSKSKSLTQAEELFSENLSQIASFCQQHGDLVKVDTFEFPLPPIPVKRELLKRITLETMEQGLQTFCEVTMPLNELWESCMFKAIDAIATHNDKEKIPLGFKLRTGGISADIFPTPAQVAAIIVGCRDRKIPMKFTAGLHHPVRMYREEVNTKMHGFLNVFTAGLMAYAHNLSTKKTEEILFDEDPSSFSFTAKGVGRRWDRGRRGAY